MTAGKLEVLPTRRLIGVDVVPRFDEHGFLADEFSATATRVDSLFDRQAVLVVAPPWSGKTYLAARLHRHLSNATENPNQSPFGRNIHATLFETQGLTSAIEPVWWPDWQARDSKACWIVDALDEDARGPFKQMHEILNRIEALSDPTRGRLLLLTFARENEVPVDVRDRLKKIYATDLLILRLAPVDAHIAEEIVETVQPGNFGKVCALIEQNVLKSVASLPAALEYLARQPEGAMTTVEDVWRGVLKNMLRDMRRERIDSAALAPIDERFAATCRIAAALTFSGKREVDAGLGESDGPGIEDVFPLGGASELLRQPARESLCSAVFLRAATGYRFAQFHVQEWFTAFALQDVPLARLRPLVADSKGPFKQYQGILGLLHKATQHREVANWIVTSHGGIPPRSDAAPWALEDARLALDRLMEVAKTTQFVSPPEGLKNLAAPGLGAVLAEMMTDKARTLAERELLIDVAQAVGAGETARGARKIVLDESEESHLRYSAAFLLDQVGFDQDLKEVEKFIEEASPDNRDQSAMVSVLIESLLRRGLWTLIKGAQYLPEADEHVVDSTAMLEYHLEKEMTLDDARVLLRQVDWDALMASGQDEQTRQRRRRFAGGTRHKLIVKAVELVAKQEQLAPDDYMLLLPIAVDQRTVNWPEIERLNLVAVFRKNMQARRDLFMANLTRDPGARQTGWWTWRGVLTEEDVDWLAGLCPSHARESPWLWADLLALAYRPSVPRKKRNEIRGSVEVSVPHVLVQFDANRRKYLSQERARKRREDKARQKQESRQYSLGEIVNDTLNNPRIRLRDQMLRLGWFCFVEKRFRPDNVLGEWADLDEELQQKTLAVCEKALTECDPTPIPKEGPFPGAILYEAAVFIEVLKQSATYQLNGDQIRKWLPAVLKAGSPADETALARCVEADRNTTEDVLLAKIKREMHSDAGSITAGNLPREHWSERLSKRAARLIKDGSLNPKARADLLRLLATRSPTHVAAIARKWSNLPPGGDEATELMRRAGLDAMLVIEPTAAVPLLAARFAEQGKDLIVSLTSLTSRYQGETARPVAWPASLIEILVVVLYKAFPPENDPHYEGAYSVGPEDELRWLRDGLVNTLFQRGQPEDEEVIKRLAAQHPRLGTWYANVLANLAAQRLTEHMVPPEGPKVTVEGRVPVGEVVRLLEDALYRLLRSDADLQRVLLEEIREIEKTSKQHLAMLYRPAEKGLPRKRLHEEALQAYFHCRLLDRLPDRVLGRRTQVFLDREPLANINQRLDIKVQAPTIAGGRATVVIEVKWSDNPDVSLSLSEQLGDEYLIGQNLSYGVYLVGWCKRVSDGKPGSWKNDALGAKPGRPYSTATWTEAFQDQARLYGESHPGIVIEPVVCDLSWN